MGKEKVRRARQKLQKRRRYDGGLLSIDQILAFANFIKLDLGLKPVSRIRRYIACGILPARVAIHDQTTSRKRWLFPKYANDCLRNLKKLEHLSSLREIQEFIQPVLTIKRRDWELEEQQEEEPGLNPPVGLSHLRAVFNPRPQDWGRILYSGLDRSRVESLIDLIERGEALEGREITDLLLLVRIVSTGLEDDPTRLRDFARAIQFLEHLLLRPLEGDRKKEEK